MPKLTDVLNSTQGRVTALENEDFEDSAGVARITKLYEGLSVQVDISYNIHQYNICSESIFCSDTLKI